LNPSNFAIYKAIDPVEPAADETQNVFFFSGVDLFSTGIYFKLFNAVNPVTPSLLLDISNTWIMLKE